MKAKDHIRWSETLKEAVERCCSEDALRPGMSRPWTADGRLYAADGHILVFLPDGFMECERPEDLEPPPDAAPVVDTALATVAWYARVPIGPIATLIESLDMVQDAEREECSECEGTGEVECWECGHLHDCDKCDGVGYIGPETPGLIHYAEHAYVKFMGWHFNPKYVERVVDIARVAGVDDVEIGIPEEPMPNRVMVFRIGKLTGLLSTVLFGYNPGESVHVVPNYSTHPEAQHA